MRGERVCSGRRRCALEEDGVQWKEKVCSRRRRCVVRGEWVCSARRVSVQCEKRLSVRGERVCSARKRCVVEEDGVQSKESECAV